MDDTTSAPEAKNKTNHPSDAPGVRAGSSWRRESAPGSFVPWQRLEAQLAGIHKRRGRRTLWEGKAAETMRDIEAQTYRARETLFTGLRIPEWLQDPELELNECERKLVAAVWRTNEVGNGGLYDNQVNIASDVCACSERTLRNMLNGRAPREVSRVVGGKVVRKLDPGRAGLIERGLIRSISTWTRAPDGGSRQHWLLLRIGPELERTAGLLPFANQWVKLPRRRGITRKRARAARNELLKAVRERRYQAAGVAWRKRVKASPLERAPAPAVPTSGARVSPPAELEDLEEGGENEEKGESSPTGSANFAEVTGSVFINENRNLVRRGGGQPPPPPREGCSLRSPPSSRSSSSAGGDTRAPDVGTAGAGARSRGEAKSVPNTVRDDARAELRRVLDRIRLPSETRRLLLEQYGGKS